MTNKTKKITLLTTGIAGTLLASSVAAVTLSACTFQAALPPNYQDPNAPKPTPQVQYNTKINWSVMTNEDWELDPSNTIIPVDRLEQDENGFVYADKAHTQLIAMLPSIQVSEIVIPAQVTQISGYVKVEGSGNTATSTNLAAFQNNTNIRTVKFASGSKLSAININAFNGCSNLENIELPSSVRVIQDNAFQNTTNLTKINLSSVTYIGNSAFNGSFASEASSQTTLDLGNVMRIGNNAFQNIQNINSIDFGNNAKLLSIGNDAFNGAKLSTTFDLSNARALATIGNNAFQNTTNVETVKFPDGFGFTNSSLGTAIFKNSSIKSIDLSKTVIKSIPTSTFEDAADLSEVKLNDEITTFEDKSFSGTSSLKTLNLPSKLMDVKTAFKDSVSSSNPAPNGKSGITELDFSNTEITSFAANAFEGANKLTKITLNDKLTTINSLAFRNSGIQTMGTKNNITEGVIKLPASVTTIGGGNNFQGTKATTLDLSETAITTFSSGVLSGMYSLENIKFPASLTTINGPILGNNNGLPNKLTSLDLSSTKLTTIGNNAFTGAAKLASVVLPDTVTTIGNNAFKNTKSLTSLELPNTITSIGNNAFEDSQIATITTKGLTPIAGTTSVLPSTLVKQQGSTTEPIGNNAFANTKLTSVDLSQTKIDTLTSYLFSDNAELTTVVVPSGLRTLGSRVFGYRAVPANDDGNTSTPKFTTFGTKEDLASSSSRALEPKVVIPSTVENFEDSFFEYSGVTNVDLSKIKSFKNSGDDKNQREIPHWFFNGDTKLQTIVLPTWVGGVIGTNTFKDTKSLQSVTVAGFVNPVTYDESAGGVFDISNSNITGLRLNESSNSADCLGHFQNSNLGTFKFPANFNKTQIPKSAFANTKISSLDGIVDATTTTIKASAFANNTNLTSLTTTTDNANKAKLSLNSITSLSEGVFQNTGLTSLGLKSFMPALTSIGNNTFSNTKITSIAANDLPDTLTTIGQNTFGGNTALTKVEELPAAVTTIGADAFKDNQELVTLNLSKATALATIGANAFSNTKLTTVDLSKTIVTTIGANAFSNNTQLESIKLPATVTSNTANIANNVKEGFTLSYPDGITVSGTETTANSFNNNQLLTDVDLSKSADLTTLLADTFSGSTKLSKVVLPAKAVKWNLNTTNNGGNPFFNNADTLNIEFTAFKKSDGSTAPTDFANIDDSVKTQIANIMNIFSRYVATADSVHPVQYSEWTPGTNNSNFWINTDLTKDTVFKSWTNGSTALPDLTDTNGVTKNHNGVTWTYKKDASNNITIESDSAQTPINIYRAGTSFDSSTNVLSSGKQTYFSSPIAGPNSAPNNTKVKVTLRIVTQ